MNVSWSLLFTIALQIATGLRALTRPGRTPASRAAWLLLVAALPVVGAITYFLFGDARIGSKKARRMAEAAEALHDSRDADPAHLDAAAVPRAYRPPFARAASVNGFSPVGGNTASLPEDENAAIDALVSDIDGARDHVHIVFYIWLLDDNGSRVLDAVERASDRGVTCRVLIDGMGSSGLARSDRWADLSGKGVKTGITFPLRWLPLDMLLSRVDVRNHRKIVVIDGTVTWVGSQNCADPEFAPKKRYGPWYDTFLRVEGPVARQCQHLFAVDWMTHCGEDISPLLDAPIPADRDGFTAVAAGTGPSVDSHATPDLFAMMLETAEDEAIVTTPYFVPDETLHRALMAAALRGVKTTLILPERCDSFFVNRASRSFYLELLQAGVRIREFRKGMLHAKTVTVDGRASCIGSANMDRRSFELNYENNLYLISEHVTAAIRDRQHRYASDSREITCAEVEGWSWLRRAANNLFATMAPLL